MTSHSKYMVLTSTETTFYETILKAMLKVVDYENNGILAELYTKTETGYAFVWKNNVK